LLERFEAHEGLVRGAPGSVRAAMIFGEYFPNPAVFGTGPDAAALISPLGALAVEALGTAILVLVIFALTDPKNAAAPPPALVPFFVGFTVAVLISLFAPLTQAGWNPARDFGPRIAALVAGYGSIAIPGPRGGFWIYIVGPMIGAVVGGLLYERVVCPLLAVTAPPAGSAADTPEEHHAPDTARPLSVHP
jgi:glycerol uptake facilitator-like aquaporin